MNAKEAKFLSLVVVMALAFVAVAGFIQTDISDAADEWQYTQTDEIGTYDSAKKTVTIDTSKLTVLTSEDGQFLGKSGVGLVTTAGATVSLKAKDVLNFPPVIFIQDGCDVTITIDSVEHPGQDMVLYGLYSVKSVEEKDSTTILTLNTGLKEMCVKKGTEDKFVLPTDTLYTTNEFYKYATPLAAHVFGMKNSAYLNTDGVRYGFAQSAGAMCDKGETSRYVAENGKLSTIAIDLDGDLFAYGSSKVTNGNKDSSVGLMNATVGDTAGSTLKADALTAQVYTSDEPTDPITVEDNLILVENFTGVIQRGADSSDVQTLIIKDWESGDITVKKGVLSGDVNIPLGSTLYFEEGVSILPGTTFIYTDEYGDKHSFELDAGSEVEVQMGGFKIYAEENNITLEGTALLKATTKFIFAGNAWLSGTIYTIAPGNTGTACDLVIDNSQGVDVKVEMLQTVGSGKVTLMAPVLVVPNSTFNVGGELAIDSTGTKYVPEKTGTTLVAVLKVADGAVVKSAGKITTTANLGYIWNAGSVYAPATQTYADAQLVRVFMNNVAGTGLFYKGSVVYYGGDSQASASTIKPIAVAYGAYLDITGICDVNITSGQTSVVNPLYKYYTMTIATDDSNIALNVDYNNYYTPEIDLLKKAPASKEKSGKYVTFRGVNWNTADSAVIQIIAPEVYDVKLVATITKETDAADPKLAEPITSGITFTDQNERVITPNANGIVSLVFGYEYTIEGANPTSKYKFIDYFELFDTLDPVDKTKATFTMVRGPTVKAIDVSKTAAEDLKFGVLQITEGYLSKVNVTVTPTDNMTEGQVFLYYKVEKDGQEMPVAYSKVAENMVIDGIYSNDNLYFKSVDRDFYKYQFGTFPTTGKTWKTNPALSATDFVSIPTDEWTAVAGVTGPNGAVDKDGKGGVDLPIAIVEDSIELVASVNLGDAESKAATQTFTITWVNVQKTSVTVSSSDKYIPAGGTGEVPGKLVKLLADEIITITWEDVDDVRQTMKILGKEYTKGAEYTVSTDVSENTELTMKLTLDKIEYAKVKNSSNKDFTVTDGNFTNAVAKTKTVDKAVEAFNASVTGDNLKPTLVTLVIEGQSVVSWTYVMWDAQATPVKVPGYEEKNVVGETAAIPLADGYTIEVTALNTIYNQYIVKTQPVDHVQIGDYSRVGHMNDNMFVYYSVDDKYTLKGVEVYYEDPENEGFPDIERGVYANAEPKTAADGQKYWAYKMPASNVYLKPIVDSDYAIITYKNYDGTVLQTGEVKKGTMPEYTGATPVKPATATETYRFAGWEPAVVAVTADATYTATFETVAPTSKDVSVTIGQKGQAINVVLYALDGAEIGAGTITIEVWYTYIDEEGDIMTESVEVTLTYDVEGKTAYVISDTTFIQELGENYGGAFAVTGTYTLGEAQGDIIRTAYTPVEA